MEVRGTAPSCLVCLQDFSSCHFSPKMFQYIYWKRSIYYKPTFFKGQLYSISCKHWFSYISYFLLSLYIFNFAPIILWFILWFLSPCWFKIWVKITFFFPDYFIDFKFDYPVVSEHTICDYWSFSLCMPSGKWSLLGSCLYALEQNICSAVLGWQYIILFFVFHFFHRLVCLLQNFI